MREIDLPSSGKLEAQVKFNRHRPVQLNVATLGARTSAEVLRKEDLLSNPDLYPVPKGIPYCSPTIESSTSAPTELVWHPNPKQLSEVQNHCKSQNQSEAHELTETGPEEAFIRSRIRECLVKAKTRNSHLSGPGSIEAGLYRLQNLLNGRTIDGETKSLVNVRNSSNSKSKDASTVTEICSSNDLDEVEIISLVQESIPKYKLKADVFSKFSGIDEAGWCVPFPALQDEQSGPLSPEQAEGALAYFVLCGNRVNQMTKTYHDIDAVTRLLEEKEKDLELAARIGQQLLGRNRAFEDRITGLEAELGSSSDCITQLRHDLQKKTELLQIYTNDVEDSSADATPTGCRQVNMDFLQRRVCNLESENKDLRHEASQLAIDTESCEDKEKDLMRDLIKQLNDANSSVYHLSDELTKKVDDTFRQQEETTQLLAQVVELQATNRSFVAENEELAAIVDAAKQCQEELTTELAGFKERYVEVMDLLHDTQHQLRKAKKRSLPMSSCRPTFPGIFPHKDSIAHELQFSSTSGDEDSLEGSKTVNRIFDTVKSTGRHSSLENGNHYTPTRQSNQLPVQLSSSLHTTDSKYFGPFSPYSSIYSMNNSGMPSLDSGADSDASMFTDSEDCYPATNSGVPGWPGTPDLENCLRRLERTSVPLGCRTPDSIMSTGSGKMSNQSGTEWKIPQKLQIIKPLEGSLTLHQWSRLATPHLGGLLQDREGVVVKGETAANLDVYNISDIEEDDPDSGFPGKQFMGTCGVFTYTNCTVLHPDDVTNLTSSLNKTQTSVLPSKSSALEAPSVPGTPSHGSRRGSTATFSTNTGIAKHLNERGLENGNKIPSTDTPANSPDSSRPPSPDNSSYKLPGFEDLTKTLYSGADFLRRKLYRSEEPQLSTLTNVKLVEKVNSFGTHSTNGVYHPKMHLVGGMVAAMPRTQSPLLHLSNLIKSNSKSEALRVTSPDTPPSVGTPGSGDLDRKLAELKPRTRTDPKPGQRLDLGTVDRTHRSGAHPAAGKDSGNMGTVSWTSLGRKGGFL